MSTKKRTSIYLTMEDDLKNKQKFHQDHSTAGNLTNTTNQPIII